jgi:beta-glucosidase
MIGMKKLILFIAMCSLTIAGNAQQQPLETEIEKQVLELVQQLTLEEKASLCSGRDDWSTKPIERLGIPSIWLSDGPHGLRRAPKSNAAGYGDQLPATCFPTASALAATWNTNLIYKVGEALGQECQAQNINVLLGPGVNIKRSSLGGRNFEFFSEDPVLSGQLGAAYINGVQSQGVGTSLKHYTANNVETWRMYMNSDVDKRTLHEIYLKPFEIAVKEAQPWTIMACYNRVQGTYGTQNTYLLTDVLKNDWDFKGIVISDWFAVVDRIEGIKAGMHIEMPGVSLVNDKLIVQAIKEGKLDEKQLDKVVSEILSVVLKAKMQQKQNAPFDTLTHHAFAREVAGEAITLLKNEGQVLPINTKKIKKIALIGEFASNPRYQGNGSSEVKPTQLDNVLEILQKEYGKKVKLSYAKGYSLNDDNDLSLIDEAKKLAMESDIAIVFAGLPLHYESEGIDRTHLDMPASHNKLISEIANAQKNTVVVLTNGSAVTMPWINQVQAILESWLVGQAGAGAIVDVLFGKINPSGKLAETFPIKLEDTPSSFNFPGEQGNVLYGERIFVGYRYYDEKKIEPLFPFGFGLSYTTFEYSNIKVSTEDITDQSGLTVSVKIKNTGSIAGKETVQLYVNDEKCSLQRPEKELKKFTKILLAPGEEKEVTFTLNRSDFSYFDARRNLWIAESGRFNILIGASSRDIKLKKAINLSSTQKVPLAFDEYTFFTAYWANPETRKFIIELMPNYLKKWTPEGKPLDEAQVMGFFADHPMIKFPYITDGEINHQQVMELVEKCKSITYNP